jgi:uncharacterized protein
MKLGDYNELSILRETKIGLYLGDDAGNEILLPKRYVPESFEIGQSLRVYVYNDSEGRPICTTLESKAVVNTFAFLECKQITEVGAFLDLGIMKDLLVPNKNQFEVMRVGKSYLVWVYEDPLTKRLVAAHNLQQVLIDEPDDLDEGDQVELIVWLEREQGWRAVVNETYIGMVYRNQTFQPLHDGQRLKGFVNRMREDGKLDILLQKPGFENIDESAKMLIDVLEKNNGFLPLTDKSDPEEIAAHLKMSKKSFKKAVGTLYKQRIIKLESKGITLN